MISDRLFPHASSRLHGSGRRGFTRNGLGSMVLRRENRRRSVGMAAIGNQEVF